MLRADQRQMLKRDEDEMRSVLSGETCEAARIPLHFCSWTLKEILDEMMRGVRSSSDPPDMGSE